MALGRGFNEMADALHERERALAVVRDQLQGILDHAPSLIYIKDHRGVYQVVNRAFLAERDLAPDDVLGHTEGHLSTPDLARRLPRMTSPSRGPAKRCTQSMCLRVQRENALTCRSSSPFRLPTAGRP